jgi:hypothetical protein
MLVAHRGVLYMLLRIVVPHVLLVPYFGFAIILVVLFRHFLVFVVLIQLV